MLPATRRCVNVFWLILRELPNTTTNNMWSTGQLIFLYKNKTRSQMMGTSVIPNVAHLQWIWRIIPTNPLSPNIINPGQCKCLGRRKRAQQSTQQWPVSNYNLFCNGWMVQYPGMHEGWGGGGVQHSFKMICVSQSSLHKEKKKTKNLITAPLDIINDD